jgi:hypothetical protein
MSLHTAGMTSDETPSDLLWRQAEELLHAHRKTLPKARQQEEERAKARQREGLSGSASSLKLRLTGIGKSAGPQDTVRASGATNG